MRVRRALRHLPGRHKAWVVAKLMVALWMIVYAIFTPKVTALALGAFIWVTAITATLGIVMSIVGMSIALNPKRSFIGRVVEMSGLIVAAVGPATHAIVMAAITIGMFMHPDGSDPTARFGPMLQSLAIAAFLTVRYVEVRTRGPVVSY